MFVKLPAIFELNPPHTLDYLAKPVPMKNDLKS